MNSALYRCKVMHHRMKPKVHHFEYDIFMFYLDLDELELLHKKFRLLSLEKFNLFSFRHADHLKSSEFDGCSTKEKVLGYLHEKMPGIRFGKICLLTHLRTLGHVFNPVSFYFCEDDNGFPACIIAEVTNTFGEMKLFLIRVNSSQGFKEVMEKHFYVSPFMDLSTKFEFQLSFPGNKMFERIDVIEGDEKIFISSMKGERKQLSDKNMLFYILRFPFITLKVIFLIHFEALRLWLKKVPWFKKNDNLHLQKEILNP